MSSKIKLNNLMQSKCGCKINKLLVNDGQTGYGKWIYVIDESECIANKPNVLGVPIELTHIMNYRTGEIIDIKTLKEKP